ncbi:toll/interleukin-1 receptor domain-containing protein [Paractinoplanes rishiriensis]|uniref:TIR domain-containing protein n=1 Tax=Paractinoplanes rishiriensis TaxID=1050105 RepID=A0A919JY82_9ACTN|nr:toll/interleukin-1 receptor domain-containing protein [Actinoplanes rishiriensis]GIE95695.1 hypothetical protein Ari01nite_31600 [Actinoplanes rishiriensis]
MGHVFVSYSRRQFYAARQLTAGLAAAGLDPWFDVERLVPGTDWDAALNRAVDDAEALVLVASKDALASAYVEREWRRARDGGIPVVVAVVRGTPLPPDLAAAPRVELRRRFAAGTRRLAGVLRGDDPPPARRWSRWPAAVLLVATALAANVLAALGLVTVAALDLDLPVPPAHVLATTAMALAGLFYAGWLLRPLTGFLTACARFVTLSVPLYGAVPLLFVVWGGYASLISAVNHGSSVINQLSISGDRTEPYVLVLLPLLLLNVTALLLLHRSATVLRWLPPGEGPHRLLARLDATDHLTAPAAPATPRSVQVEHAPADALIAAEVASAFRTAGVEVVAEDADLRLVLVSNAIGWTHLAPALRGGRAIAVLACGVRLPAEAEELHRFQWLDFRDGRTDRLRAFAASLTAGAGRVPLPPVPRAADAFDAPRPAKIVLECLAAAGAVFALSAAFTAGLAVPKEERVHTTERPTVPNPPLPYTRPPWHQLLSCPPGGGLLDVPLPTRPVPTFSMPPLKLPLPTRPLPTRPLAAQPPAVSPPAARPPAAQPPAAQPPAAQPPAAQPPAARPPAAQPPAVQPPAVQPPAVQPPAAQPVSLPRATNPPPPTLPDKSDLSPDTASTSPSPRAGGCRFVAPALTPASPRPNFIENPDFPALPDTADTVLRWRAWLAAAMAVLALTIAYRLGRRELRRDTFQNGMFALFGMAAAWALMGVTELTPLRLVYYAAIWIAAAVALGKHGTVVLEWLPDNHRRDRRLLRSAPAALLPPTLPTVVLLLAVWYAGGVVL